MMVFYINNSLVSGMFWSSNVSKLTKDGMMCCYEHCAMDKVQDIHCTIFSIKLLSLTAPFFPQNIKVGIIMSYLKWGKNSVWSEDKICIVSQV
jgi:hypothetical protein